MKDKWLEYKDWHANDPDKLPEEATQALEQAIRMIPEPPLPSGFVEAAMANWRKSRLALPVPVDPIPLTWWDKLQIVVRQGFWVNCLLGVLLFIAASWLLNANEFVPPLLILPVVGCIPMLVVLSATARQSLCRMGELTRSLRVPLYWYLQARMLLIGGVCLLVNGIAAAALYPQWGEDPLMRVVLLWCIPMLVNTAIALVLAARIREFGQLVAALVLLPVMWLILSSSKPIYLWLSSVEMYWLAISALAALLLMGAAIRVSGRDLQKGGVLIGA